MSVYYLDLEELPCPSCGGVDLIKFPWVLGWGRDWRRHVSCEGCGAFLVERYDDDMDEHEIHRHTAWGTDIDEMLDTLENMSAEEARA